MTKTQPQPTPTPNYLSSVVVPRSASTRDITALETTMQGLALGEAHPVALEVAANATSRRFLLRSTTPLALRHLEDQVRARYPQAAIMPGADDDPLCLHPDDIVSGVELEPGAAAYLPLRSWKEREFLKEGTDPLLGILAVFNHLPQGMRMVSQLSIIPASATWSQAYRRKAVEHPLEQERLQHQQQERGTAGPGMGQLLGLNALVAMLLVWLRFKRQLGGLIPAWLIQALVSVLHGKDPHLAPGQVALLIVVGIGICLTGFLVAFFIFRFTNRQPPMYSMRQVDERTERVAYRVRLRLFAIASLEGGQATDKAQLSELLQTQCDMLDHLVAAYRQYHLAAGGYFVPRHLSQKKLYRLLDQHPGTGWFRNSKGWASDVKRSRHLLSVADLAALWHLPQAQDLADLPFVKRGRARTFLAPQELGIGNGWKIGESEHAGQSLSIFVPGECLRHNLLAVASTGKGKSTLFLHLARATLALPDSIDGLVVIEPHSDLIGGLLGVVPTSRQDSVVVVDLANRDYPVGINPLDMTQGRDRDKAVDNLITIFERLWEGSYGTRTENILEYTLKTLAAANETLVAVDPEHGPDRQYTLLDVVPLLRRTSFRHAVLEQVTDVALLEWWQTYYEPLDLRLQSEITSSVITKMSKFASSLISRRILGQPRSSINLGEVIRQGQVLLVSTASGIVGSDLSELIGNTLLGLLQASFSEQAALPITQRKRFLVLIDEFQTYRGANYQTLLAELRKYGGSFGLATQSLSYLDRLDRTLRATVLANIDHLFAFAMAGEDARLLHELDDIEEGDITNLDDFACYVKLSVGGRRLPVFSLQLDAPPISNPEWAHSIRQESQRRYARPVGSVDDLLKQAQTRRKYAASTRPRKGTEQEGGLDGLHDQEQGQTFGQWGKAPEGISTSRKKRRGGGNANGKGERNGSEKSTGQPLELQSPQEVSHPLHMMYGEDTDERNEMEK